MDVNTRGILRWLTIFAVGTYLSLALVVVVAAPPTRQFPQEATTDDRQNADLEKVAAKANELIEQVDAYGLAQVETEQQLREEIRKLRDRQTELEQRFGQIEHEHAKLWLLMHTPPMAQGEADPVKEFMEAKRPEVFAFSPWFACPFCKQHQAWFESHKTPFDVHWGDIKDEDEAKGMKVPANASYPLYRVPTKQGDMWLWGFTPEGLVAEFERRNK